MRTKNIFGAAKLVFLLGALLVVISASPVSAKDDDLHCKVSAVVCGELSTMSTELGVCNVLDIAEVGGSNNSRAYAQVQFFWGYKISGDALILGSKAKSGMLVTCKVPFDAETKKPDYKTLKKQLPALLKENDAIRKAAYPALIKRVRFEGETIEFDESPTQAVKDGIKAEPKFKSHLGRHDY